MSARLLAGFEADKLWYVSVKMSLIENVIQTYLTTMISGTSIPWSLQS